jgi:PAS domain S-box-containing protein
MKKKNNSPIQAPLRVLILEDNPADAELVVRELRRATLVITSRVVEGKKEFSDAIAEFRPDVILSDFKLPTFDGMTALKIAHRQAPDTPFMFVSGSIGEEKAIETLTQGASDYIFKDNLARLGPAVKKVLAAAELNKLKLEAEESLGESERMFSTLVANLPGFVYRCRNDHDWTMEYISEGCREITGYTPEDFIHNRKLAFNDIIHPDQKEILWQEWQERLNQHLPFESEYRIMTAAGGIRWVWERGQGIFSEDGSLLFLEGFITDITPRRQAEDRLRQSEEYYRTLVETSPDAIVIADAGGRVTFASLKTHDLFGLAPQTSIIGTSIMEFVEPAEIPRVQVRMVEILAGRSLPQVKEYRLQRQDRRPFWGEVSSAPLRDAAGRNVGLLLILRDVSERKNVENALRESEEKYRLIAENTAETISVLDLALKFIYVSPSIVKLRGYTVEESLGLTLEQTLPPDSMEKIREIFKEEMALEAGGQANPKRSRTLELQEYRKDGSLVWVENSMSFLRDPQGKAIGFLAVSKDISERKQAEEQVQYQAGLLQDVSDAIIATDANGAIRMWNRAAETIYGWKADEVMGKFFHEVIKPEYPGQSREEVYEALENNGAWSGELSHWLKDGRHLPVQSTITILRDAAGLQSGQVSINHDISERKRSEEMLVERDQLLKNLSAQVPGMVYTFRRRPDGTYCIPYTSNAIQGIFGVSPQEVIDDASAIFKPIVPEDQPRVVAAIEDSARTLSPWQAEYRVQLPGKPVRWMLGQSDPVRLTDGSVLWYGFNTDISERKAVEAQIRSSLKEKEVLLQEIHHRVKNNLQIISGLLTLQADQSAGKSLEEIFRDSQDRIRTIALIHEKLYRSHNLAEIAFDEYLRALTDNLIVSYEVSAGRIGARYEMEPILLTIEKAIPLGLIVNELVTNSLKHAFPAGRRGEIRIGLHGYQGAKSFAQKTDSGTIQVVPTCELTVADDGVGLPAGQSPLGQKTLGMNLVSMLAQQLRAELKVNTGNGTEFRLRFPGLPGGGETKVTKHGE